MAASAVSGGVDRIDVAMAGAMKRPARPRRYRLAGTEVRLDVELPFLAAFAMPGEAHLRGRGPAAAHAPIEPDTRCQTRGYIGGRERRIALAAGDSGVRISIESVAECIIGPDGLELRLVSRHAGVDDALLAECLLGLPLILCLALRGRWMFHAASVLTDDGIIAIAGDSGAGKSTLAARLDREASMQRLGDDLLCLQRYAHALEALPAYPQLKLPQDCQPWHQNAAVRAIVILRPRQERLALRRLNARERVTALLRHSVGSKVFPPRLLAQQLEFCGFTAGVVPLLEVDYPLSPARLEELAAVLAGDFDSPGRG